MQYLEFDTSKKQNTKLFGHKFLNFYLGKWNMLL